MLSLFHSHLLYLFCPSFHACPLISDNLSLAFLIACTSCLSSFRIAFSHTFSMPLCHAIALSLCDLPITVCNCLALSILFACCFFLCSLSLPLVAFSAYLLHYLLAPSLLLLQSSLSLVSATPILACSITALSFLTRLLSATKFLAHAVTLLISSLDCFLIRSLARLGHSNHYLNPSAFLIPSHSLARPLNCLLLA